MTTRDAAESTRSALLEAALRAYDDAGVRGLCAEGRWEAAVDAMRSIDLAPPLREGATPLVMTVLEAHVPAARREDVERVFREGMSPLPPEIVESFLVRSTSEPSLFRLTTIWRSMEDLQAMRASGEKPKGVQMFEAVEATPELSVFGIVVHSHRS